MSFNDRCGEAAEILRHGGVLPDDALPWLIELLEEGRYGAHFPPRELVFAILEHPENAELRAQTSDGEWVGE